jgi:hypothetical protein
LKTLDPSLACAILAFDVDHQMIFGVSIDDEGAEAQNLEHAKTVRGTSLRSPQRRRLFNTNETASCS